jgi:uncharacterized protein YpuA (DUF1002 family)
MTAQRTIFLFKNDIRRTIDDTVAKMNVLHNGDEVKVIDEVAHRLQTVWGITLADWAQYR